MKQLCLFIAAALLIVGCGPSSSQSGEHWRQVGALDGGFVIFVEVDQAYAQDGATYKEAADKLMANGRTWQIGFFLPGDQVPSYMSRGEFFRAGGWEGYAPTAVYMKDGFTKWDCERAGAKDAPSSALCGEGAQEQYSAVLRVAAREGWVTACGLSPFDGRAIVEKYAVQFSEQRSAEIMKSYDEHLRSSKDGPDDPAACGYLADGIIERGNASKKILEAATPKG